MARKSRGGGREMKTEEIVMDDTTFSIVSYLCGLNALGSRPQGVLVHLIRPYEEEAGTWSCC